MPGSSSDGFVHLHVHTEYSMLDGAARLDALLGETARMGMPALAITDHGNVFGAFDFWSKAKQHGVRPIIGMEGYYVPIGSRHDRKPFSFTEAAAARPGPGAAAAGPDADGSVGAGGRATFNYSHMTLLAENDEGLGNLFRLSSLASIEGQYRAPRFDRELLERYGKGLIATTGCPSGEVNRWLQVGRYDRAVQAAADFRDILGPENFFVELMDHGLEIERQTQKDLIRLARDLGLPMIATNDLHYTFPGDADAHEVLLCVQTGKTMADPKRFRFDARDFYLKSPQEMRHLWRELPEACDNTLLIAERCDVTIETNRPLMPRFPVPEGHTEASWLDAEVARGLERRFPGGVSEEHRRQAAYEVGIINQMGFPGYFLVTADLCRHAREQGIRVGPGRGSAAGALIAYALGITELDPLAHGLLFERFLNPERVSMPDIDMDFDERRRGDMIRYATQTYGDDRVAQIITYGTIKAKAAVKDAARVLGLPFAVGDRITKAMPPAVMGKDIPLSGIFDEKHPRYAEAAEFRALVESDAEVARVIETARGLEGLKRQWGVHAAGVILSSEPLLDVVPLIRREQDGAIITQFDLGACEKIGLLKMDFLGLRNLTVLDDALLNIRANRGVDVVLEDLTLDDKAAYELLARGDTLGVFQLDGGPMRALLRSMVPTGFEDISAVLALYRPGPMGANAHNDYADRKNGRKPVEPIHPELAEPLAEILGDTYGLIVYQEQVMAIAQKVAGYSLGAADLLRRAMGKKKKEILDKEFVPFSEGMRANGYSQEAITRLWDILVPFSDYAFNKAHTAGYGLVSYWTAYLKANYPTEYMAALLTSVRDDKDKSAVYLTECRRMGIKVLPPDVNESDATFSARGDDIRFGLTAIRNVGANVVDAIVAARRAKGRYADFTDFLAKVDQVVCNKRVVESLIKAGAFDSLGHPRAGLYEVFESAVEAVVDTKRKEAAGQFDLFGAMDLDVADVGGGFDLVIPDHEWDKTVLLAFEREMLGLWVSDHPILGHERVLRRLSDASVRQLLDDASDGRTVTIGGVLTGVVRKVTKDGKQWASASLEDLDAAIDVLVFPATYAQVGPLMAEDAIVVVRGRLERRDDTVRITALDLTVPELGPVGSGGGGAPLVIALPRARCVPAVVDRLVEVLNAHPGPSEVHVRLDSGTQARLGEHVRVDITPSLLGDLKQVLGPACVVA